MIEFGGIEYYIDMDALDKTITPVGHKPTDKISIVEFKTVTGESNNLLGQEKLEKISDRGKEIDGTKYDIIRLMLEVLIDYDEDLDDSLGADRALAKTPLSFKLAFNTLYNYGIIKEKE